jgi:ribosomal protein L23
MALFSKNTKKDSVKTDAGEAKAVVVSQAHVTPAVTGLLKSPRITEKATASALESVFVFDVTPKATKRDIIMAVRALYKVTPRKVTVVAVPTKAVRNARTGIGGKKGGGKKAYVYLKKGETISIH